MLKSDKVNRSVFGHVRECLSTAPALVLVAGFSLGAMQAQADEITIKIKFENKGTEEAPMICPTGVSEPDLIVNKQNKTEITWMAYDANYEEPVMEEFAIYFDPFKNSSLESSKGQPKNQVTSPKLGDFDVPLATYKYTVLGTNCPEYPHDPRITVK